MDRFFHDLPDIRQMFLRLFPFESPDVFPKGATGFIAPLQNFSHCAIGIGRYGFFRSGVQSVAEKAAADAIDRPGLLLYALFIESHELHSVWMVGKEYLRLPENFGFLFSQNVIDRLVGHMAFSGRCKGSVECDLIARCPAV